MQGNISFDGLISGAINGTGDISGSITNPGSGSNVDIMPTISEGTKIADYVIDDVAGALYAPAAESGSTVNITPTFNAGQKIADYTIDGQNGALYIPVNPEPGDIVDVKVNNISVVDSETKIANIDLSDYVLYSELQNELQNFVTIDELQDDIETEVEDQISTQLSNYVTNTSLQDTLQDYALEDLIEQNYTNNTDLNLLLNAKQNRLIAGTGISIIGNTISATGGGSGTPSYDDWIEETLTVNMSSSIASDNTFISVPIVIEDKPNDLQGTRMFIRAVIAVCTYLTDPSDPTSTFTRAYHVLVLEYEDSYDLSEVYKWRIDTSYIMNLNNDYIVSIDQLWVKTINI